MSKAFLRESDFEEIPELPPLAPTLPPGAKNYLTGEGARRLRDELQRLSEAERLPLLARATDPDSRIELQAIDQRIRVLQQSLGSAEIVAPGDFSAEAVRFGSNVTVREADGQTYRYVIVGVDETELFSNGISWQSPLAKALINSRPGDHVSVQAPGGRREMEIVSISRAPAGSDVPPV